MELSAPAPRCSVDSSGSSLSCERSSTQFGDGVEEGEAISPRSCLTAAVERYQKDRMELSAPAPRCSVDSSGSYLFFEGSRIQFGDWVDEGEAISKSRPDCSCRKLSER
jgi:hypothetical protein